jgi:hypothetical protein
MAVLARPKVVMKQRQCYGTQDVQKTTANAGSRISDQGRESKQQYFQSIQDVRKAAADAGGLNDASLTDRPARAVEVQDVSPPCSST